MFFVFAFVTPETIYKNRFKTEYLYEDKEDFLFPEFTHLSPQAVKLAELWCPRSSSGDTSADLSRTFGYQDRYNELRCDMNSVHGDFKIICLSFCKCVTLAPLRISILRFCLQKILILLFLHPTKLKTKTATNTKLTTFGHLLTLTLKP